MRKQVILLHAYFFVSHVIIIILIKCFELKYLIFRISFYVIAHICYAGYDINFLGLEKGDVDHQPM